jgi:hypothetical protein
VKAFWAALRQAISEGWMARGAAFGLGLALVGVVLGGLGAIALAVLAASFLLFGASFAP